MKVIGLLLLPLVVLSDGCGCVDCGGFPLSYISIVRLTVHDSSARGVAGAKVAISATVREQIDTGTTDSTGVAVLTHIMFENPESATVTVHPSGGALPDTAVRALLRSQDTTRVAVTF